MSSDCVPSSVMYKCCTNAVCYLVWYELFYVLLWVHYHLSIISCYVGCPICNSIACNCMDNWFAARNFLQCLSNPAIA